MAVMIGRNPGLKGQYGEMLEKAWRRARARAARDLADCDHERLGGTKDWKALHREREREMPLTVPYTLDEIAAFDPKRDKTPRLDAWPRAVARRFETMLGPGYALERKPRRGWSR